MPPVSLRAMVEMNGYSDPINHALAFAAKHHDQQVRRGTRLPYITAAPNIAIILTRYGQDDETVVAGVLLDVVEDYAREGVPPETFDDRVGEKFGSEILDSLLGVVERRYDDDGVELSQEERREDLLQRLMDADERGRWVKAAELLHGAGTLVANLARTEFPETAWSQLPGGRAEGTTRFRRFYDRLTETNFRAPIMTELGRMVDELEAEERRQKAESRK
ncbi:MAG TPA: HD domain-containing protein [Gemmatimonadaceae bacterium]|nr:HD domain-containing protein [Gemmatimonadaceae bacterium]